MQKVLNILLSVAVVLLLGLHFLGGSSKSGFLGSTQTYPLHLVQNPTSFDQVFAWGGLENAGTLWQTGAMNVSTTPTFGLHLGTSGAVPTLAVGGAGWTAGTISGNDIKGVVSSTPAANTAGQITVNFATAYTVAPICDATPANSVTVTTTNDIFVTTTVSGFSINYQNPANPVANLWTYQCIQ